MHSCDFCGVGIADLDGALVPGSAMNEAINRGYTPVSCPNWSVMRENTLAVLERERQRHPDAAPPANDEAVSFRWNALLRAPMKNWRLCNDCFSTLGPLLPAMPPPQGSYYDRYYETPDEMRFIVPVNVSGLAIAAGYFGILAIFPLFAPVAILLGVLALIRLKKFEDQKLGGKGRARFAIFMGIGSIIAWTLFFTGMIFG